MNARLFNLWYRLQSSFWFIPAFMVLFAIVLWYVMNYVDTYVLESEIELWWVYSGGIDGARSIMSSIAASSITVAATVFSITVVVLSLASRQFGSRILKSFIGDRGNQIVLGTFLAAFIYCLLMLGTLRGIGSTGSVPQAGVMMALLLAISSIGVLVYFIHHISSSIQSHNVVAAVAGELLQTVNRVFPKKIEEGEKIQESLKDEPDVPDDFESRAKPIKSNKSGYIQEIDLESLMEIAVKNDLVLQIQHRAGHFIGQESSLVLVNPEEQITKKIADKIRDSFIIGREQTAEQDLVYSLDRIVQIAVAALSPSYNDPFTVVTCLDWIGVALCDLAKRKMPSPNHYDRDKKIRVIEEPMVYPIYVDIAFNKLHHTLGDHDDLIIHLLDTIAIIGECVYRKEDLDALRRQTKEISEAAHQTLTGSSLHRVEECYQATIKALVKASSTLAGLIRESV